MPTQVWMRGVNGNDTAERALTRDASQVFHGAFSAELTGTVGAGR